MQIQAKLVVYRFILKMRKRIPCLVQNCLKGHQKGKCKNLYNVNDIHAFRVDDE